MNGIIRELKSGTYKFKDVWEDNPNLGYTEYTEVYIKDGYDEEFDPWTHIGDLSLIDVDDLTDEELEEKLKELE